MAGQKPARRRSASSRQASTKQASSRQAPVRPGSPTAQASRGSKGQSAGKSQASRKGQTAGTAVAGGMAAAIPAAAIKVADWPAGGPAGRLLWAAWSPFRAMGWLPLATLILSLYGLGASIYLTIAHYDTSISLACSDRGLINCEEVTTSSQSMVFGIFPVAVLGLAFYVFMVAVNSPWGWRLRWPAVRRLRLGSVIAGMGFVLYLIYAEVDEIHAICLWCTSVHVATFLIFALLVFYAAFSWEKPAASGSGRLG